MLAFFGGQRYSHEIHIYQKLINGYFKKVKGRRCRRSLFFFANTKLLGHFVSYMLMLGHAGVQAPRRDTRYRMFAPSEPTCCTSEMSVNRFPAASSVCNCFTWNNDDYQVPN